MPHNPPLLSVEGLKVHFPVHAGVIRRRQVGAVKAVDGVSFTVRPGETLGLVGESGCGKSTTGLAVLRMQAATDGRIIFDGSDITRFDRAAMRPFRRRMQMIYQDPFGALDPRMSVADIIAEPMIVHDIGASAADRRDRARELLAMVGLRPDMASRYVHEFSGGQRQRIGIARALALNPALIVADEPVSALDVSVQAQILNLMLDLQDRLGLTYLFVAHDLSVVKHVSDRVAVMYVGRIVELAETEALYGKPLHPYTEALLSAAPTPVPGAVSSRIVLEREIADPANPPPGCPFHPRCRYATAICKTSEPSLAEIRPGRWVSCHHAEALDLAGVVGT